jgi:hypothetical protein
MSTDRITFFYSGMVLLEANSNGGLVAHPTPPVNTPMILCIYFIVGNVFVINSVFVFLIDELSQ